MVKLLLLMWTVVSIVWPLVLRSFASIIIISCEQELIYIPIKNDQFYIIIVNSVSVNEKERWEDMCCKGRRTVSSVQFRAIVRCSKSRSRLNISALLFVLLVNADSPLCSLFSPFFCLHLHLYSSICTCTGQCKAWNRIFSFIFSLTLWCLHLSGFE